MIQRRERAQESEKSAALSGKAIAIAVIGGLLAGAAACAALALLMPKSRRVHTASVVPSALHVVAPVAVAPAPIVAASVPAPNPMLLTAGTETVPVLVYHEVGAKKRDWADVSATEFAGQMSDLTKANAHPISIQDFYDHFATGKPLPFRAILLTFDGCAASQFENALPLLERLRFPAVFFAPTDWIGRPGIATWEQLRQAIQTGLITIGSQTASNPPNLTNLDDAAIATELSQSRRVLQEKLGGLRVLCGLPQRTW